MPSCASALKRAQLGEKVRSLYLCAALIPSHYRRKLMAREKNLILADVTEEEAIRRFYWIWTLKEAYTKALGIGLGFDFRRIEYDVVEEKVTVNGEPARGWW
ncbi:hypothetical protein DEU56DRAFT_945754 [Suillus clintonianus]|uniref:uncharacterized protein n=1 Tax=Suillus clintonianus TaxID=1904413 RepID=UPI001B85C159|nr:uncharacterized protein DEU56DRAFT_945754 [Suillus clintonianus]KAG2137991.1 hypothetical protein DEU56DRAFT_945754 [Suillus clintonianus]